MNLPTKRLRTLLIPIQIAVSILILYILLQNVNLTQTYQALAQVHLPTLAISVIFFIFSSLAIGCALHGALKSTGAAPPIQITQLANFGGQLLGDVTPAKSGYFVTPVLLNQLKAVPIEKGLISIMSVGAINFFIKAAFSTAGLIYFINRINIDPTTMNAMLVGIILLLAGGIGLTILVWTNCLTTLLQKLAKIPLIGILIKKLDSIRTTFAKDKTALRKSAKTTTASILASILLSATSLYIVAQALQLTQITFQDLLFMGPLTAVFMYVPITFAGLGLQEAAYVFLLTNLPATAVIPTGVALSFALLVRLIGISTDLIGLPAIIKTSTGIFSKLGKANPTQKQTKKT